MKINQFIFDLIFTKISKLTKNIKIHQQYIWGKDISIVKIPRYPLTSFNKKSIINKIGYCKYIVLSDMIKKLRKSRVGVSCLQ